MLRVVREFKAKKIKKKINFASKIYYFANDIGKAQKCKTSAFLAISCFFPNGSQVNKEKHNKNQINSNSKRYLRNERATYVQSANKTGLCLLAEEDVQIQRVRDVLNSRPRAAHRR